jgi:hypothetical protein
MNLDKRMVPGVATLLWGPPGIGKTASVYAYGLRNNLPVVTIIASIREPSDFLGLPVINKETNSVDMCPPGWAKQLVEYGKGVLFFDEINTAPKAVQDALFRVVLERVVGELELPRTVKVIAAANPIQGSIQRWRLDPALRARFKHVRVQLDPREWIQEFPTYWGNPPVEPDLDEEKWRPKRALVASFIHRRPDLLLKTPDDDEGSDYGWPCPRTWDYVSRTLLLHDRITELAEDVADCVGEGAAHEFVHWAANLDLPDPIDFMEHPNKYPWPDRGDKVYALLSAVVAHGLENETRWNQAWQVVVRAAEENMPDIALIAARQLRTPEKTRNWERRVSLKALAPILREMGELP